MREEKRNDINDRYYAVLAEKGMQEKDGEAYRDLSKIAKLILSELQNGNHPRHIMYMSGTKYYCRCE